LKSVGNIPGLSLAPRPANLEAGQRDDDADQRPVLIVEAS
jgi:hypothetical protein